MRLMGIEFGLICIYALCQILYGIRSLLRHNSGEWRQTGLIIRGHPKTRRATARKNVDYTTTNLIKHPNIHPPRARREDDI